MTATPNGPEEFAGLFVFDTFIVDTVSRTLSHDGALVALNSKAFDTLMLLVSNAGETVAKDTLLEAVWPGVAVEENNLNQAVSALRKALGDTASPRRFIITIPNRGYRFVRPVTRRAATAEAERATDERAMRGSATYGRGAHDSGAHHRGAHDSAMRAERMHLRVRALLAGGLLAAGVIGAWWAPTAVRYSSSGLRGAELTRAVPITSEPGDEEWPRFSPDGTRIAFLWRQEGPNGSHIAVKTLGSEAVTRITTGPGNDFHPVWSPDGQSIAFLRGLRTPDVVTQLCLVPASGGEARVLHSQPWSVRPGLAWWDAGHALILPVRSAAHLPFHLAALDPRTMTTRALTMPPPAPLLTNPGDALPAISPDGRQLAFVRQTHEGTDVFIVQLTTLVNGTQAIQASAVQSQAVRASGASASDANTPGEIASGASTDLSAANSAAASDGASATVSDRARRLTFERYEVLGLAWHPSGDSVIVSSPRSGVPALYRVMLADGAIARLPNVDDGATQPAVDPRGGRLAYRQEQVDTNIYRVDVRAGVDRGDTRARRIIASSRLDDSPHVSPDGMRIAFDSSRSGAREIWVTDAEGKQPRQVTFLRGRAQKPQWSPDGRSIAFDAIASGRVRADIYVIDAAGGSPRALTADASVDMTPTWAADGQSLYFLSDRSGAWEIWNVPAAGGQARRVTEGGALRAQESADGAVLFYGTDAPEVKRRALRAESAASAVSAASAAADQAIARFPADTHWGGDWTIGARGLYYLNEHLASGRAIELLPFRFGPGAAAPGRAAASGTVIGTAPPVRIAYPAARASERSSFSVAPDESWLVYSQEDYRNRDIMLLPRVP